MTSLVHTTVTQTILERDLIIPLRLSTTRRDLASVALTMSELSFFEPDELLVLSPSPSKENHIAKSTDSISFGLPSNPEKSLMASLLERVEELERQNQGHISERRKLNAQVAMLQPIARRILTDAYLSIKGYRSSLGARSSWISSHMAGLLPPTGTTASAFEQKLASYRMDGDISAHSTQTLAIALAVDVVAPPDEDLQFMFSQCFGHTIEEELNGSIPSTLVKVGKDGTAHLQVTPSPIP